MMALTRVSPKFRSFPEAVLDSSWSPVRKAIFSFSLKLGLSEPLKEMEISELCRFLRKTFKDINLDEMIEAVDLFCSRDLAIDYKKEGHYNKLSNTFMGTMLTAFRKYRSSLLSQHKGEAYQPPQFDTESFYERCLFEKYDAYVPGEEYPYSDLDGWMFFDDLYRWGIVIVDEETRAGFMAEAEMACPREKRKHTYDKGESDEDLARRVKKKAKQLAFRSWINEQKFSDTDLRELLKPLIHKFKEKP